MASNSKVRQNIARAHDQLVLKSEKVSVLHLCMMSLPLQTNNNINTEQDENITSTAYAGSNNWTTTHTFLSIDSIGVTVGIVYNVM